MSIHRQIRQVSNQSFLRSHLPLIRLFVTRKVPSALADLLQLRILVNERRGNHALLKLGMRHDIEQEWNIGLDTTDATFDQNTFHPRYRFGKGRSTRGILDNHRIEVGSNRQPRVTNAVHTNPRTGGMSIEGDDPGVGREVPFGIFRGDATLDGDATGFDVLLFQTNFFEGGTTSDADLGLYDVDSRDFFGDGVFDLNPRIDLNKIRLIILIEQKLHSPRILILHLARQVYRILVQLLPQLHRQTPRRRHFNHLLMPSLNRTVTFPKVDDVALPITNDLDLNVPWTLHVPFRKTGSIAK
mmetsp:Transcript_13723/g.24109  ORF Transcript_13723/g.24109 Transcript_13723/m.24109 type:complete len:299 (-) Transcript_13723:118-1014(-)